MRTASGREEREHGGFNVVAKKTFFVELEVFGERTGSIKRYSDICNTII